MSQTLEDFTASPAARPLPNPAVSKFGPSTRACDPIVSGIVRVSPSERPETRRWARQPYCELVALLPVEPDGRTVVGEPVTVRGQDISMAGLSFRHATALPGRTFVAGLRDAFGHVQSLTISLTWTRFEAGGGYQSGGRFLRPSTMVLPPLEDWSQLAQA